MAAGKSFYREHAGRLQYLLADGSYQDLERAEGIVRFYELRRTLEPIEENEAASYFDIGNEVGLIEFHSKANALGPASMQLIEQAVAHATDNCAH